MPSSDEMLRSTSDVALQIEIAIEYFRSKRLTARISDPPKVAPRFVMLRSNKPAPPPVIGAGSDAVT